LSDADAVKGYGETAYQVGLLAPMGAAGRLSERGGARAEVFMQKQEEARKLREEEVKKAKEEADKLEAYKQTDEYLTDIQQKYADYQTQFADLTAKAKAKTDPDDFAGAEAKREARKQLAEPVAAPNAVRPDEIKDSKPLPKAAPRPSFGCSCW